MNLMDLYVEQTPLASQLAESRDPEALRLRADECEAEAMACDAISDDAKLRGNPAAWRKERAKAASLRARAKLLRMTAERMVAR